MIISSFDAETRFTISDIIRIYESSSEEAKTALCSLGIIRLLYDFNDSIRRNTSALLKSFYLLEEAHLAKVLNSRTKGVVRIEAFDIEGRACYRGYPVSLEPSSNGLPVIVRTVVGSHRIAHEFFRNRATKVTLHR